MKFSPNRLFFTLFCLILSSTVSAQIISDSTVQVCAYWQQGDRYTYQCTERKYKVVNGDTTDLHRTSECRTFEVIKATKRNYRIALTYSDFQHSDPDEARLHAAIEAASGPTRIVFETDECGSLERIVNLKELTAQVSAGAEAIADSLWNSLDAEARQLLPRQAFKQYLTAKTADPALIAGAALDDIGRMFFFHGTRLDLDSEYTGSEQFTSLFGSAGPIEAETRFWADSELTDKYSGVFRTYTEIDAREVLAGTINEALKLFAEAPRELPTSMLDSLQATMEQYTVEEIHFDTGWPLHLVFDRYLSVQNTQDPAKNNMVGLHRSIDIVLPASNEDTESPCDELRSPLAAR